MIAIAGQNNEDPSMWMLIGYLLLALSIAFFCSLLEAILLSATPSYIQALTEQQPAAGQRLRQLKQHIDQPLGAILTLNTIANTVGAIGVGAESARLFGEAWLGVTSGIMTLLILMLTEILPKTLAANHWRQLAPHIGKPLQLMIWSLKPFIWLAEILSRSVGRSRHQAYIRDEISAMAELGIASGELASSESRIIKSLLQFRDLRVTDIMTPRTVLFALPADMTLRTYLQMHAMTPFSRIPLYEQDKENIIGYVHKQELLLAHHHQGDDISLRSCLRRLYVVPETSHLPPLFQALLVEREHIALVVNEYGEVQGIVTMEDLVETLLGLEIVEQGDAAVDMQRLARQLWQKRIREHGIHWSED